MLRLAMHFASGNSLITGAVMLLGATALSLTASTAPRCRRSFAGVLFVTGVAFVVLSTSPIPTWGWGLFALSLATCGVSVFRSARAGGKRNTLERLAMPALALVLIGMMWVDLALGFGRLEHVFTRTVVVVGDSLSAAETDPKLRSWPDQLTDRGWVVDNRARMGATAKSALAQVESGDVADSVVLLVIGGNDVLGATTPAEFEQSLNRLVTRAQAKGTTVALFELPLPPLHFEWGRIIRRVATRQRIALVNRRLLAEVLGGEGNTVDGIHLSQDGHDTMARLVAIQVLPELRQ